MKNGIIYLLSISAIISGCKTATESENLPLSPYQRAVSSYPSFLTGLDSSMDACLSLVNESDNRFPDSTIWNATAAFNIGDYPTLIGLVSIGKRACPFFKSNDYYRLSSTSMDSTIWSILNYDNLNFSETVKMPQQIKSQNHAVWDTVSKSSGFNITYSGYAGGTLIVSGIFLNSAGPFKDSVGNIDYSSQKDNGSLEVMPEMLKDIPIGSKFDIELVHGLFYSKVISQNSVSHKIGFYTQTETDFFFILGK